MQKIKNWKKEDRPRERLINNGVESLSDSELIGILLNTGNSDKSAVDLAKELLYKSGNSLSNLSRKTIDELQQTRGIGEAKAAVIKAIFEISKRLYSESPVEEIRIHSSASITRIIAPHLQNLPYEECWVFYMNRANRLIFKEKLSFGGTSATIIDIKLIIKKAVDKLANSIILVHNHPSGNPSPSEQDKKSTSLLKEACRYLDITLLDHIIIARDRHYSFADEGIL